MSIHSSRRPHLVERAIDAARSAAAAEAGERLALLPQLAPVPPGQSRAMVGAAEIIEAPFAPPGLPSAPPEGDGPTPISRDTLEKAGLVGEAQTRQTPREEIALVSEQVLRAVEATVPAPGRDARIVLLASARAGEGKSFAALNIAASIAEGAGQPVVLVDTEGGEGSLTALLGQNAAPGLQALRAADGNDPASLLVPTDLPGLSVLPRGPSGPTQAVAIAPALLRLAARLPKHVFVVDTPACLEASTAGLLAATAGQVVLVVQAEQTQRGEVEAALDILDACPTLQLLLNRVTLEVSDRFGGRATRADHAADRGQD